MTSTVPSPSTAKPPVTFTAFAFGVSLAYSTLNVPLETMRSQTFISGSAPVPESVNAPSSANTTDPAASMRDAVLTVPPMQLMT